MRAMVNNGEVDALAAERVGRTGARIDGKTSFEILHYAARERTKKILPEVEALFGVPQPAHYHPEIDCGVHVLMVVDDTAKQARALEVRFAALGHDLGKATTPEGTLPRHIGHEMRSVGLLRGLCDRLRVPGDCRDLALLVAQYHGHVHRAANCAPTPLKLFDSVDRGASRNALRISAGLRMRCARPHRA